MTAKKRYLRGALVLMALLTRPALAQDAPRSDAVDLKHLAAIAAPDEVDRAVEAGVKWLVSTQDPMSGAFPGKLKNTYTGLSCLALMAAGHFPGRSEYGESLRRGVLHLVDASAEHGGYFGKEGNARMYGHAICTLALTEAYGMLADEEENRRVKQAAEKAIDIILRAQVDTPGPHQGGWRYEPTSADADLSVAAWQILALRSAADGQLAVPAAAMTNALEYVRRTYTAKGRGFAYQPGRVTPTMRCAGVVCMRALGAIRWERDIEQTAMSAAFLSGFDPARGGGHFFYQAYYVATAASVMGGDLRAMVLPRMERHLLALQQDDGSFKNDRGYDGGAYATAFSVICLSVRYQYLPIYQE